MQEKTKQKKTQVCPWLDHGFQQNGHKLQHVALTTEFTNSFWLPLDQNKKDNQALQCNLLPFKTKSAVKGTSEPS